MHTIDTLFLNRNYHVHTLLILPLGTVYVRHWNKLQVGHLKYINIEKKSINIYQVFRIFEIFIYFRQKHIISMPTKII